MIKNYMVKTYSTVKVKNTAIKNILKKGKIYLLKNTQ